ncbi:MAG: alpha/beta-hydrolase family protein, partial [Candidatus Nanopelagicales bacterium]
MAFKRPEWISRWSTDTAAQAGVIGAAWSVAGSLSRGLLPRSPVDQAIATGATAPTPSAPPATPGAARAPSASIPGTRPGTTARVIVASGAIVGGYATAFATAKASADNPAAAVAYAAGRQIAFAGISGGAASLWDDVLHKRLHLRPGLDTTLVPNLLTGAAIAAGNVYFAVRRAHKYGNVNPDNHRVEGVNARSLLTATGIGVASFIGLGTLVVGEQLAAHGLQRLMKAAIRRDPGAAGGFVAHAALLGAMGLAGTYALRKITHRLERKDDIIEPAYPAPPTNPHVSAGPASDMPFDSIGKEGRRFVTMALTHDQITAVMAEPAVDPVRVVCGYETTDDLKERAALGVADLEACGGFERSLICVASPTGVGYVNYTIIEALEYLTRGNCATIVPQYALVPSALAMPKTLDGVMLTRHVLEAIQERLVSIPAERRPRVVLMGESLGANVALDV